MFVTCSELERDAENSFLVAGYAFQQEDKVFCIHGRIAFGRIKIGTAFNTLYRYVPLIYYEDFPPDSAELLDIKTVEITVRRIISYGRDFQELDRGSSCSLYVSGEIHESDFLETYSEKYGRKNYVLITTA